jgi:hypothetical protein
VLPEREVGIIKDEIIHDARIKTSHTQAKTDGTSGGLVARGAPNMRGSELLNKLTD